MTRQASSRLSRRTILKTAAAGAAVLDFPLPLRAQAPVLKIGVVHPVTGPLAEPGQARRQGATMGARQLAGAVSGGEQQSSCWMSRAWASPRWW